MRLVRKPKFPNNISKGLQKPPLLFSRSFSLFRLFSFDTKAIFCIIACVYDPEGALSFSRES
jgi:hypothetical protein